MHRSPDEQPICRTLNETDAKRVVALSEELHYGAAMLAELGLNLSAVYLQQALESLPTELRSTVTLGPDVLLMGNPDDDALLQAYLDETKKTD